jgi:hypothetical protein
VVEGALENQICKGDKEVLKAANESSSLVFCITQLLTHTQQTGKKKREGKKKKKKKAKKEKYKKQKQKQKQKLQHSNII